MKTTEVRDKDGGILLNFLADITSWVGCWLVDISMPYAKMYTVELEGTDLAESGKYKPDLGTRYQYRQEGRELERESIRNWVEDNRTKMGDPDDPWIIRDHFTSEDLLRFLDREETENEQ